MNAAEIENIKSRELTSNRSPAAIVAATLTILLCGYALFEALLMALDQDPLVATPETWWHWIATLPESANPYLLAGGGLALIALGLTLCVQGIREGRLARHSIRCEDAVLIVDDQVIAAALARRARLEATVGQGQVLVVIHGDHIEVQIRPTSGTPINREAVVASLEDELRINMIEPEPQVKVHISASGVIGQ